MSTRDFGTDLYVQKGTLVPGKRWNVDDIKATVQKLLGASMVVDESGQFSADNYFSATDSRHGLHFTIRGRAENVMVDIATHLAQFTDPINLVLGKRITRNYKVVVTRHEMMGGRVEQVPERAPARLVTSREVKTEVELARYGNDVTIDTNLLASPEDFAADVNRKVTFQKQQFQQKLIELGYECLMNESTNLVPALARSIPTGDENASYKEARKRYMTDCFGAFNYYKADGGPGGQPTNVLGKILQHVRMAATATAAPLTVMIVPAGADIQGYQREPKATFSVTGIKQNELAPVQFPLPSVVTDPITNLQIGVSYPLMSYDRGTRNPQAMGSSGLTETCYLLCLDEDRKHLGKTHRTERSEEYDAETPATLSQIFINKPSQGHEGEPFTWEDLGVFGTQDSGDNITIKKHTNAGATYTIYEFWYQFIKEHDEPALTGAGLGGVKIDTAAKMKTAIDGVATIHGYSARWAAVYAFYINSQKLYKLVTSSAIVAAPGPDTGEMLVAYPQTTAHSVEVAPEEMKMQMRAYLGAAIYNSANVIRIPHVLIDHFEETPLEWANIKANADLQEIVECKKDVFNQITKKIVGRDLNPAPTTAGAFVDPSASTSGGGGVAPSSSSGAVSSGDVARKKKSSKLHA